MNNLQQISEENKKLHEEIQRQNTILEALRYATDALKPIISMTGTGLNSKEEVLALADSFTKLVEQEKRNEEALRAEKERVEQEKAKVEAIIDSIVDAVIAIDPDGNIILMNSVAENFSGFKFLEAQNRKYNEFFKFVYEKEFTPVDPSFIEKVVKSGVVNPFQNPILLVNRLGESLSVSVSAAAIKDGFGKILGCILIVRDTSRERALEKAKDDFISIAAHQLRTPLGSMRWTLEMILKQIESGSLDTVKEKIERIYESDKYLITLVNDLLNISRIEQGMVKENPQLVDILEIVNILIRDLEGEIQKHNETIIVNVKDNRTQVPKVMLDPELLREIIQNLISNAIKYNTPGGKINIGLVWNGNTITLSVADQGIGIPEEDQPKVFSKFYRAQNALKTATVGSGLGLFVVKSYVEKWGGKIYFKSKESQGTTFYIELPIKKDENKSGVAGFIAQLIKP